MTIYSDLYSDLYFDSSLENAHSRFLRLIFLCHFLVIWLKWSFQRENMENKTANKLMELIPADIRHHFVPRKGPTECRFGDLLKMIKNDPRWRSQFVALEETLLVEQFKNTQLQLELEKFKTSTTLNDDRESESDATETVLTKAEPSASVKAGIHELTNRPYGPWSKHEFKNLS